MDNDGHEMDKPSMIVLEPDKVIDPDDMVGRTFPMDPDDQGLRHCVEISLYPQAPWFSQV